MNFNSLTSKFSRNHQICPIFERFGGGAIRNRVPFETPVIPAKAGIHFGVGAFAMRGE